VKALIVNSERHLRGGEFQTMLLGQELPRAGCDVMLAVREGSALAERVRRSLPCATFRFEKVPISTPVALARVIERWRPDVIHAQTSDAHTHAWLARKLLRPAPPLVVSRRVAFPVGRDPLSLCKYRAGVAHYIPISSAAAASLAHVGVPASRMTVVPSGIDVKSFQSAKRSLGNRKRWGIPEEALVVGTVGAFEAEKGHLTLVRAAAKVVRACPQAHFVFVGEGTLRGKLETEISGLGLSGSIVLVVPRAPLEEVLPLFDIFALPSLQEGLSTALIAALASGLPAVASMTGGVPDVINAECGMLVPPGDTEALAQAIIKLGLDVELRKRLGHAGGIRAMDFDIASVVRRIVEVYRHVLGEEKSP
jgi:glycosyltransferase involved in cell wall biosynthesis